MGHIIKSQRSLALMLLMALQPCATTTAQTLSTEANTVVASVAGRTIRIVDLDAYWQRHDAKSYLQAQQLIADGRERALELLIEEAVLEEESRRTGVSVSEIVRRAAAEMSAPVTEQEVAELYARSGPRAQEIPFEDGRRLLRDYLGRRHTADVRTRLVSKLRRQFDVRITNPLPVPRETVNINPDDPTLGDGRIVDIVTFSDFQCPYCKATVRTLQTLVSKYASRVRLIWKDFPLPTHPLAVPSAQAAHCAGDQGRFWEYHDALFRIQESLTEASLNDVGRDLGLAQAEFVECVRSHKHRAGIQRDVKDGRELHVDSTPTVFINGRRVVGAAPLEAYEHIVASELASAVAR